jgi:hypothetical protein
LGPPGTTGIDVGENEKEVEENVVDDENEEGNALCWPNGAFV